MASTHEIDPPLQPRRRILIASIMLCGRSGTEIVVRDLAVGLSRRRHRVLVYAPLLGATALELAQQGITVVDDLRHLHETPDVVHGHHNLPVLEALARFPDCPALWVCHDWRHWWDRPPLLGRIHRYGAVDRIRFDYLVRTVGIPRERVFLLPNAVDLTRIPPRPSPLPEQPEYALAFTKTRGQIPLLRDACRRAGLALATLGRGPRRETRNPERELVQHDVVFATGRSAIEALCAGCAVIVGDARGLVGMVTTANYEELRANNFGMQAFVREMSVEAVVAEIGRYRRSDAAAVTARIRADAGLDRQLDTLERLYAEALEAGAAMTQDEDARALRRQLRQWHPRFRLAVFRRALQLRSALRPLGLSRILQERHHH